jgi:hypothetical protein
MSWTTPKTDWHYSINSAGLYSGDRFNAVDFNRIKNNLEYLRELSLAMYDPYTINSLGSDRTPSDYFYADEINALEENLNTINSHSINRSYGTAPTYQANGSTMDYVELNRLESAILDLYNRLNNQADGRRNFTWNFGMKGGIF